VEFGQVFYRVETSGDGGEIVIIRMVFTIKNGLGGPGWGCFISCCGDIRVGPDVEIESSDPKNHERAK